MATVLSYLQRELDSLSAATPIAVKKVVVKEVLQSYVLNFIYNHSDYKQLRFYGGTCARIIFGLNRMSEDLDFDNSIGVDLSNFAEDLSQHFSGMLGLQNAEVKMHSLSSRKIARHTLKIPILEELGLSTMVTEKIHVKVETSSHRQHAQVQTTPVVRHDNSFVVNHFDAPTLFSGKIIACLERVFKKGEDVEVKGRDYYDLIWYMQQQIVPCAKKLKADAQTPITIREAFLALEKKVKHLSRRDLSIDLVSLFTNRVFIEDWLDHFHEYFDRYKEFYFSLE